MSDRQSPASSTRERSLRRPYLCVLPWVLGGWTAGILVLLSLHASGALDLLTNLTDVVVIAVASGAIAVVAMLPGILGGRATVDPDPQAAAGRLAMNLFAGMAIRLVGTVALFLTCRYHMATSSEMIAGMTIGWYVLLTSIEVSVLARELPKTTKAPNFAETSLG